jgi:hypothetical protein
MAGVTPTLNLPKLKRKGISAAFHGIRAPFYTPTEVFGEGQPLKHGTSGQTVLKPATLEGHLVFGLSLQETYTQSDTRHKGHHYANDTRQELTPGCKIGVLVGHGFARITSYEGVVNEGDRLYVNPATGKLVASGGAAVAGNRLPVVARESGNNTGGTGKDILIEFDFPTTVFGAVQTS